MRSRGAVLGGLLVGPVAVLGIGSLAPAGAAPVSTALRGCASPVLDAPARGEDAIRKVGAGLPRTAALGGRSSSRLRAELRKDPTSWISRCGRSFYVEAAVASATTAEALAEGATTSALTSDVPVEQAFALHSRPGSARVIYLDFTGHLISGTGWNDDFAAGADIAASAFDTDGSPSTFSAAERAVVIAVFQRVAEDFAPLDVDVTTADPGEAAITRTSTSDTSFGTRALITNTSLACGGCAGIGYLDVFDSTNGHSYTQPALAFSPALSGSAKLIAETVSHEVGHNLGLEHDGTTTSGYFAGQGAWSPIMGAATSRPITQWNAGDYAGANNQQDDLAVMAGNGAPLLADDHGSSAATATTVSGSVTGLVGQRNDADWFSFSTAGGPVTVTAAPISVGADLDLRLDLLDAAGTVLATSDPASSTTYADPPSGLASSVVLSALPAGSYTVRVDGNGAGSPTQTGYSDYGSLGRYSLTVNAAPPVLVDPLVPAVSTSALPGATLGRPWTTSLLASGGQAPYTWSAGLLPSGLTLAPEGTLTGTPTVLGTFAATVTVMDSQGATATRVLSLVIRPAPRVTTATLPTTTRGRPYAAQLAAAGGLAPYTWLRTAGSLPAGLSLTSAGRLAGTPTASGAFPFTVRITDATGQPATRALSVRINASPVVTTSLLPIARKGVSYGTRLTTAGGTPALIWRVYAGTLPTGMRLSSTGVLSGTPSVTTVRNVTFQTTDARGAVARRTLRVAVA